MTIALKDMSRCHSERMPNMNRLDPPISEHEFVSTFFVGIGFENVGPEKRRLRFQISPLTNNYVPSDSSSPGLSVGPMIFFKYFERLSCATFHLCDEVSFSDTTSVRKVHCGSSCQRTSRCVSSAFEKNTRRKLFRCSFRPAPERARHAARTGCQRGYDFPVPDSRSS